MSRVYLSKGRWGIDYVDAGRRIRQLTDAQSKTEARALLSAKLSENVKAEIIGAASGAAVGMKLEDFIRKTYLPHVKATRTKRTYDNYAAYAETVIDRLGSKPMRQIRRGDVEDFLRERIEKGTTRHGTKLAPASINREMSFLRAALYNAMTREYIPSNPAARIKLLPEENERTRVMTPFEEKEIIGKSPEWMRPVIRIAVLAGLRQSEILELRRKDVRGGMIYVSAGCKSHERREVPITPDLEPVLASLTRQKEQEGSEGRLFWNACPGEAVGKLYTRDQVSDHFTRAVRNAEVKDLHFHDLRRTFASRLAERGVSLQTIADLLGHGATYVTERYAHLRPETLREAVALLSLGQKPAEVGKNPATEPALRVIGGTRA